MANNVRSEFDLYLGMCKWLETYLKDKFKNKRCEVFVLDCHSVYLDSILDKYDVIQYYPQVVGLKIEIDVLGIVRWKDRAEIYLIEAKKTALNLQNLGLLSSSGLGSLEKVLNNLNREDLLDYGSGKKIKKIKVARWDVTKDGIDNHSIVPKI